MADLFGASSSSTAGLSSGSEDFSSFLNQHFSNSSSPYSYASSPCMSLKGKYSRLLDSQSGGHPLPLPLFSRKQETTSASGSSSMAISASGLNFSDPGSFSREDIKGKAENAFSFARVEDCDANAPLKKGSFSPEIDLGDFSCDSENGAEASKLPSNSMAARSSSKRSRAAEVHNLSEKRRRRRINEKMKALQNLIPNSNKTDKASMLDDAIEYLKQLQLQVQMLSMRNGFSLHPSCLPGRELQPVQLPQLGTNFDSRNAIPTSIRELETLFANKDCPTQSNFSLYSKCSHSEQPGTAASEANNTTSDNSFRYGQLQAYHGHYDRSPHSEGISKDRSPKQQLDCSETGKHTTENGL